MKKLLLGLIVAFATFLSAHAETATNAISEQPSIELRAANPNLVIGHALRKTGNACLGIGVPSAIAGLVLVTYGNVGIYDQPQTTADVNRLQTKNRCAAAGYVLLPMGSALTIVGIPLRIHGKRIMKLGLIYTGNGAGMSLTF